VAGAAASGVIACGLGRQGAKARTIKCSQYETVRIVVKRGRLRTFEETRVNELTPLLDRLEAAAGRLAATQQRVQAGEPWPVGAVAEGGGEAEWGPTEVLAHVAEMLPYWLGEMERVIAGGGANVAADGGGPTMAAAPAPFGRTAADPLRTLTIARDATLPARELYDRISAAVERYRRRLPSLAAADIGRRGLHPTRGELTVPELVERFAVSHLEDHAEQLEVALAG
jgi:hypothetical protein